MPVPKSTSRSAAGGGAQTERLRDRLDKKNLGLQKAVQDLEGRTQEKKMAMLKGGLDVGASFLGSLFGGRRASAATSIRRGASAMGGVTSKNRMEDKAEARVDAIRPEIAALEADIASASDVDPARFEEKTLVPTKTSTKILRYDIVWVF